MRQRAWAALVTSALVLCVVPLGSPSSAGEGEKAPDAEPAFVSDEALVGIAPGARGETIKTIREHGAVIDEFYKPGRYFVVETPTDAVDWTEDIEDEGSVGFVEPNYLVSTQALPPDDPDFGLQWSLDTLGMTRAWEVTTGSHDVVVGLLDTGVDYTHEDIGLEQIWTNPGEIEGNGIDDDANGYVDDVHGWDCFNDDADPMDDSSHGTHVAGILGARSNNGIGISGVTWDVGIMPLKFLNQDGLGRISDAIECLDYAVANGAELTSNSWYGGGYSRAMFETIRRARSVGQLFVTAAGNWGADIDSGAPSYPSAYDLDNIVGVAATDVNDKLAGFSNFGPMNVDIAAPGEDILSTLPGNFYASFKGTSMATPHVAGTAVLILAAYPGLSYRAIIDRLYGSVVRSFSLKTTVGSGGRLDVGRALEKDGLRPGSPHLAVESVARNSVSLVWRAPYENVNTGGAASSYTLRYRPSGAVPWATAPAPRPLGPGTVQRVTVAGLSPNSGYDFVLVARDNVGKLHSSTVSTSTGPGTVIFHDDFESGTVVWGTNSTWKVTREKPHSGARSLSDSPLGPYLDNHENWATSPPLDLTGSNLTLSLWHRYNFERGYDSGSVEISTDAGVTWTTLAKFEGGRDYGADSFDLSSFEGATGVRIRFHVRTDTSVKHEGWYIDDVLISSDFEG